MSQLSLNVKKETEKKLGNVSLIIPEGHRFLFQKFYEKREKSFSISFQNSHLYCKKNIIGMMHYASDLAIRDFFFEI